MASRRRTHPSSCVFLFWLIAAQGLLPMGWSALARAANVVAVDYARDIRPILSDHCLACHGPDAGTRQAGLRLDQRQAAISPLKSGNTPIRPGRPSESELVRRIESLDADIVMPPRETKRQLTEEQKQLLRRWIEAGAPYSEHWAYRPPARPIPPAVRHGAWLRNAIDPFVLAKLEALQLSPAPEASPTTLMRRLSLDLTGLPPTIEEIDSYLADAEPGAVDRLVDRLLASPHYGEKMAQDWLDLARFGDSSGYQDDGDRPNSPYRDYVIEAFNANMPFDQFTIENLAGDLLPNPTLAQKVASGFNRLHRHNEEGGSDPDEFQVVYAVDRTNTMATVWMGVTLGCAQCHDHKYDPIRQREYYQLYAFFNSLKGEVPVSKSASPPYIRVFGDQERLRWDRIHQDLVAAEGKKQALVSQIDAAFEKWLVEQMASKPSPKAESPAPKTGTGSSPAAASDEVAKLNAEQILALPAERRTPAHQARLRDLYTADKFPELANIEARRAALKKEQESIEKAVPLALVWEEMEEPRPASILTRGDYQRPGERVQRDVPGIFARLPAGERTDRLALAHWLVGGEHPLTSRVTVNRLWKQCFGVGLVRTPEDFGVRGEWPTHPELLDWLATEFAGQAAMGDSPSAPANRSVPWDVKRIIRQIVLSATYQQSSQIPPSLRELDPENRLLARGARFRLSAEEIRDMALAASSLLTRRLGGRSVYPYQPDHFYRDKEDDPGEWKWPLETGADLYRRGLYTFLRRTTPYPSYQTFDATSRGECTVARSRTNTPLQALVTMNDPTFVEAARVLGERLVMERGSNSERMVSAFRRVLARPPAPREQAVMENLLTASRNRYLGDADAARSVASHGNAPRVSTADPVDVAAWASVAAVLLNLDEAITRE